ncbi:hypothetical protein Ae201684_010416 [Aphanomyces euteiches]|uniref:Uncharacterized protein n=1 Tax=Aphanomyces euteiches TaxID=100861 RepID=A0A6G0WYF2_9STRA|nr:hypothetical protein Ae201684_010416 [Aphanomyces euteiches]
MDPETNNEDDGLELLQRARLLVQAATNLPDFSTLFSKRTDANANASNDTRHRSKPPKRSKKAISPPTNQQPERYDNKSMKDFCSEATVENLGRIKQLIICRDEQPTKRPVVKRKPKPKSPVKEPDKVESEEKKAVDALARKYAQERAAARVAAKLREKMEEARQEEQTKAECVQEFYETLEEKELRLKQDRKRAKERAKALREKLNHKPMEEPQPQRPEHNPDQIEKFQRETKERLKRAKDQKKLAEMQKQEQMMKEQEEKQAHQAEDEAAAEEARRRAEQLRRETKRRLKAMQAHKEEMERKEMELRQQGLEKYKHYKDEMERVAKGLPVSVAKPKANSVTKPSEPSPVEEDEALSHGDNDAIPDAADDVLIEPQDEENNNKMDLTTEPEEQHEVELTGHSIELPPLLPLVDTKTKKLLKKPQKKAVWQRPPVPIPTTEYIVHRSKLMPPSVAKNDSYADRMKSRSAPSSLGSQAERLASATRERAKQMDKSFSK